MAAYLEQYDRMQRWYKRFSLINYGRVHDVPSENYRDEIYAFFMNCYHLKDWLKEDAQIPSTVRRTVEAHINTNRPLLLCPDICNSLKHVRLEKPRSDANPTFGKKEINLGVHIGSTSPTTISLKCEVNTDAGAIDAFQLATECINAWDIFLSSNALR